MKLFIATLLAALLLPSLLLAQPASWSEERLKSYIDTRVDEAVQKALAALAKRDTVAGVSAPPAATYHTECANGVCRLVEDAPCACMAQGGSCPCRQQAAYATGCQSSQGQEAASDDSSGGRRQGPIRRLLQRIRARRHGGGGGGCSSCGN